MPSSPPVAGGATPLARVSPPGPLARGHRRGARAGARIRLGPGRSDQEYSRGRPSAVRWAGPRRIAAGPIRRSGAAAYSATAATTTTRPRYTASRRGGRETPPSAATCPSRLADDQRELALSPTGAIPAPGEKIEFLLTPDEGVRTRAPPRRPPPLARTTR